MTKGSPTTATVSPCATALKTAKALHPQAVALVQQFHQRFHGISKHAPHAKEIAHASTLLEQYGLGFASFFLTYVRQAARDEGRTVHVFGGLMRYEASALAAYQRHVAREVTQQADATAEQQRRQLETYETWLRQQLQTLKTALTPAQLQELRAQAQQRLGDAEKVPLYALERCVAHKVDTQLMQIYDLPSFDVWSQQQDM